MGGVYNWGDAFYRLGAYVKAREVWGMDARAAARYVNTWFQNYAEAGEFFRQASMSWWGGPFARFQGEMARITYNGIKYRPVKMATMVGVIGYGWNEFARATAGISD